jgi:myo-inositol-1(or 4)-monophosphatase
MTSSEPFHKELEIAKAVIKEAGKTALSYFEKGIKGSYKADNSIVTEADVAIEKYIKSNLEKHFSEYGFIGEESGEITSEVSWIVDPIDGTLAFARGLSEFSTVIALKQDQQVVLSVMYLPYFDELFYAINNNGSYRNDVQIHARDTNTINEAVISLHEASINKYRDNNVNVIDIPYRFRATHTASVESCYVACGKIDGLIKFNQAIWDVAPEYLMMKEAGVRITDKYGNPLEMNFNKQYKHDYIALTNSIPEREAKILYFSQS